MSSPEPQQKMEVVSSTRSPSSNRDMQLMAVTTSMPNPNHAAMAKQYGKLASSTPYFKDVLPEWAYDEKIAKLADSDEFKDQVVPMGLCVGPAVLLARKGTYLGWISLILFTGVAFSQSKCDGNGFAYYPMTLWLMFIPIILVKVYFQFHCLKFCIIPFVQTTGPCKLFGLQIYFAWLCFFSFMTAFSSADYATDSLFLAVCFRADVCEKKKLEAIWHTTMSQSMFAWTGIANIPFKYLVAISYLAMFIQPCVALLYSTPTCDVAEVNYDVNARENHQYPTFLAKNQNHGDNLYILAEVADMVGVQVQTPRFPRCKAQMVWSAWDALKSSALSRSESERADSEKEKEKEGLYGAVSRSQFLLGAALQRGLVRIGLIALLENTYQINLQVSIFAMFRFLIVYGHENSEAPTFYKLQTQTITSIAISCIMAFLRFGEAFELWKFADENLSRVAKEIVTLNELGSEHCEALKKQHSDLTWQKRWLIFACCVYSGGLVYAATKFYFAFHCEEALWNVTGCVAVDHGVLK